MNDIGLYFNDIYSSYYKRAFLFVKSYVHNDLAAEDIASESLIRCWESLKDGDVTEQSMLPYLLTILKHKALDYLKHEEVKRRALENIEDWKQQELSVQISVLEACNPEDLFSKEVQAILRSTLEGLPYQTRQIFILSRFQNKTNREIAEQLNISVKGVEYHISRALKVLRVALKDYLLCLFLWI